MRNHPNALSFLFSLELLKVNIMSMTRVLEEKHSYDDIKGCLMIGKALYDIDNQFEWCDLTVAMSHIAVDKAL